jgi:hypothetical protein
MELIALTINIETCAHPSRSEDIFIGVFDLHIPLEKAKKLYREKCKDKRHIFTEKIIKVNEIQQ